MFLDNGYIIHFHIDTCLVSSLGRIFWLGILCSHRLLRMHVSKILFCHCLKKKFDDAKVRKEYEEGRISILRKKQSP